MKFLLIGNGFIGPKHQEAIKAVGGELYALCDIDPSKRIEGIPFFIDYREALRSDDFQAVSIAAPNYLHADMVIEAARLGKRILCEKPMTFRMHEIDLMKGVPRLFGMFQLRHLPELPAMREAAKLATTVHMKVEMKRSHTYHKTWKGDPSMTGGLLINIGSHYFDLLGHLFGYVPDESIVFENTETNARGIYFSKGREISWHITLTEEKPAYERSLTIGDQKFDLVQKENLHVKVYQDFMWNHGVTANEEERILKMIKAL